MAEFNHISTVLRVCVNSAEAGHIAGLVYSRRFAEPIAFSDIGMLLLRLDEVLDRQNFPQAFQRARTFTKPKTEAAVQEAELGMSAETVAAAAGTLSTFALYVISRRNASWQGQLDWMDGSPTVPYESALELLKLIQNRGF
ncbi:MAG: hypothetical protein RRY53_03700 [Pseudoflavonifractor sp.]